MAIESLHLRADSFCLPFEPEDDTQFMDNPHSRHFAAQAEEQRAVILFGIALSTILIYSAFAYELGLGLVLFALVILTAACYVPNQPHHRQ